MPRIESQVEKNVCDAAEASGWLQRKLSYPGRRGAPDRMFIKAGRVVFIEFKRPEGGRVHPLQAYERKQFEAHGATIHLCCNEREAFEVLGI